MRVKLNVMMSSWCSFSLYTGGSQIHRAYLDCVRIVHVCCSALHCVAFCCSLLQGISWLCSHRACVLQCVALRCILLQSVAGHILIVFASCMCVAVRCIALHSVAVCCRAYLDCSCIVHSWLYSHHTTETTQSVWSHETHPLAVHSEGSLRDFLPHSLSTHVYHDVVWFAQ